jgi:beta-glucanase (GH16 family)
MSGWHTPMGRREAVSCLALMPMAVHAAAQAAVMPAREPAKPVAPVREAGYKLVKNWDFVQGIRTQEALRQEFHTRYVYANGTLDTLNHEWSRYRDKENHVFTSRGLSLTARAVGKLKPGHVESGMLRSRWSGQYGVYEIRMKVPPGRGLWPAFWLNPQDGVWPPEIDVVEIVNNGRDDTRRSFHFLHGKGDKNQARRTYKLDRWNAYGPGFNYADDFHVFSVEWTADSVRHYVDDVLVTDRDFRWIHDDGRPAGDAHVLVNLAVGGDWPGPPEVGSLPATLDIEYVRVWQR